MKLMKQLKFWSKEKKRKKALQYHKLYYIHPTYNPPPPPLRPPPPLLAQPPSHCECHFCDPTKPSAPPLPPWLEIKSTHESYSSQHYDWDSPISSSNVNYHISISQEMSDSTITAAKTKSYPENDLGLAIMNHKPKPKPSEMPDSTMAKKLECGELATSGRQKAEISVGLFSCVVDVGAFLFRCLIPCFRVSECRDINYSNSSVKALSIEDVGMKIV